LPLNRWSELPLSCSVQSESGVVNLSH